MYPSGAARWKSWGRWNPELPEKHKRRIQRANVNGQEPRCRILLALAYFTAFLAARAAPSKRDPG